MTSGIYGLLGPNGAGKSTALFGHEWWKLLAECGALLVLALFVLLNLQEPRTVAYDTDGLYYMHYMQMLEGPLTEKQDLFLEAEENRFDALRAESRQLSRDYAAGIITESERNFMQSALESALKPKDILKRKVLPRIDQLKALQAPQKPSVLRRYISFGYCIPGDTASICTQWLSAHKIVIVKQNHHRSLRSMVIFNAHKTKRDINRTFSCSSGQLQTSAYASGWG